MVLNKELFCRCKLCITFYTIGPKHSTKKTICKKKDEKFRYSDAIYDFVGRTGKRWKFVCDVLSKEHMAELQAEHKVVKNNSKRSDGVYYFICPFGRTKNGCLLGTETCPPCHFSMMTRIVEVENGKRVRKLYQGSTGHNHAEDAEMPQSQPAEVQSESHSNASAKNHKKGLFVSLYFPGNGHSVHYFFSKRHFLK